MSTIYPILPERLQLPGLNEAMAALQRGFNRFGIDFYIIGAVARDIWVTLVYEEQSHRITKDLDLAVFISDLPTYEALHAWLVEREGFGRVQRSESCLLYPTSVGRVIVDLLPFGAIADEWGDVYLSGQGMERISTVGFAEVLAGAATMATPGGEQWRVATLPGLVALKLVAWQDRPESRGKDATDIWNLLSLYFEVSADDIYNNHTDLFDENDPATPTHFKLLLGARVLGRHLRQLLAGSLVTTRLLALLDEQLGLAEHSRLARTMSRAGSELASCLAALAALRTGLAEDAPPTRAAG